MVAYQTAERLKTCTIKLGHVLSFAELVLQLVRVRRSKPDIYVWLKEYAFMKVLKQQ